MALSEERQTAALALLKAVSRHKKITSYEVINWRLAVGSTAWATSAVAPWT